MRKFAVYFDLTPKSAKTIIDQLNLLATKIVAGYKYISFGFSDMSEDGHKGIIFNVMYGNELIHDVEYEQTLTNLKNNINLKLTDGTLETYFLDHIIQCGDKLPESYWAK